MEEQQHPSPFEDLLTRGSYEEAIRDSEYKRAEKTLLRIFLFALAVIFIGELFLSKHSTTASACFYGSWLFAYLENL